ncbi:MAG: FecR domain-containing protein [Thermomonas sp.]|uniref:FecR family protein n=1 Tax=Thermomonas sp. TaxID=1971895 RepID=UPI00262B4F5A|nr:FecR domain-containing protein [Thermomonas sp.]MCC7095585.1 FecR domain-containing protein [Thermomonas sp.]
MHATSDSIEQSAAEWLARRDGCTWTDVDQSVLDEWLAQHTAHRVAFLRLQAAWDASDRLRVLGAGRNADGSPASAPPHASDRRSQMLSALRPQARWPHARPRAPHWGLRLATAAVLATCALFLARHLPHRLPPAAIVYTSVPGVVRTLTLGDGSRATLSSDSRIEVTLSDHARDVRLSRGEAIFEVAKDPGRPFRVAADGYRAIAVGTRYAVRKDAADLRVVVTEGTVRLESPVSTPSGSPSILLPAGSVALVRRGNVLVRSVPLAQASEMLTWSSGMLAFRDTPLSEVAAEFNRFNTRKLVVADADAAALRIGGRFRWDNQDAFVRLLEAGFPIRADRGVDHITLRSR